MPNLTRKSIATLTRELAAKRKARAEFAEKAPHLLKIVDREIGEWAEELERREA